ncbi:TIGR03084 family metal-binding protein [Arthrobacter mobilis]|uniref:TIGR03084 family protein n=1 Tax=Arthrobacter mobilis TaxID=2724944 RepID=A0A7X6HCT8_9MICC|nr:TIGR03084 family metal-binding protein [Arthrobacter mobilis]NKX54777.1 TIGR03084 family protein [Arthrobacter mobilis]
MAVDLQELLRDLEQESTGLEAVLRGIGPREWDLPTPAPDWTVRHQVAHLDWTDEALLAALREPERFARLAAADPALIDTAAHEGGAVPVPALLARWAAGRQVLAAALAGHPPGRRIPWIGPPMGAAMAASARIMETFAHGQDIRDALGLPPVASPRLRHVAHLAVAARDFSFRGRGLPAPAEPFRIELAYDGESWGWGPEDAAQRVAGQALDFALLATRRRHRADCRLEARGADAQRWLEIAQAYAGDPGPGRRPLGSH